MTLTHTFLKIALGLVWFDGVLELALAESCLWWIHDGAAGPYHVSNPSGGGTFTMTSQPQHMLFELTRAASAAGILAFVVATAGIVALQLRKSRFRERTWAAVWYRAWPYVSGVFAMYTLAVTIALNVLTNMHDHQMINVSVSADLGEGVKYPLDSWTLPNFYAAVKMLLEGTPDQTGTVNTINAHLRTMLGWRWNLVPLVVLQVVLSILTWLEFRQWTQQLRTEQALRKGVVEGGLEKGIMS
ncbi:hypothetical protein BR93DRAFT_970588 [Coniochaeta sp. PMI_546]|nr:hypothetical protein BR93DRAFT_970588 [Coniochaeta sp. PMI_546]